MHRVAKSDAHRLLERAADDVIRSAGLDHFVSQSEQRTGASELAGTDRDLFVAMADGARARSSNGRLTASGVLQALVLYKDDVVQRDIDNNGLSETEAGRCLPPGRLAVLRVHELRQTAEADLSISSGGVVDGRQATVRDAMQTLADRLALDHHTGHRANFSRVTRIDDDKLAAIHGAMHSGEMPAQPYRRVPITRLLSWLNRNFASTSHSNTDREDALYALVRTISLRHSSADLKIFVSAEPSGGSGVGSSIIFLFPRDGAAFGLRLYE